MIWKSTKSKQSIWYVRDTIIIQQSKWSVCDIALGVGAGPGMRWRLRLLCRIKIQKPETCSRIGSVNEKNNEMEWLVGGGRYFRGMLVSVKQLGSWCFRVLSGLCTLVPAALSQKRIQQRWWCKWKEQWNRVICRRIHTLPIHAYLVQITRLLMLSSSMPLPSDRGNI